MHSTAYSVGIIGSGLAGVSAAIALRRAGHLVTIYSAHDQTSPSSSTAALSIASNGTRFFREWGIDIESARPVLLRKLIRHKWSSGDIEEAIPLGDHRERFGSDYSIFDSAELHSLLQYAATVDVGEGRPVIFKSQHRAVFLDMDNGVAVFENGFQATHDLIICADGSKSLMRLQMDIRPHHVPSASSCYSCTISNNRLPGLGLGDLTVGSSIHFWGQGAEKVIMSSSADFTVLSCYSAFVPDEKNLQREKWNIRPTAEHLTAVYPNLDPRLHRIFSNAEDTKMTRLYSHDPYAYWVKGRCCLIGDAAHPMATDQTQSACMAIEDAGALGIIFSEKYATLSLRQRLRLFELERKPRATKVQESCKVYKLEVDARLKWSTGPGRVKRLTVEEVCGYDMHAHVESMAEDLGTGDQYW